ncbi:tautomerase family protein [Rhizobium sp. SIMBA_035]
MPLVKIHVLKGRFPEDVAVLLETIHDVVVECFGVPPRDRYQKLQEHDASHIRALDTGLDIARTENVRTGLARLFVNRLSGIQVPTLSAPDGGSLPLTVITAPGADGV